MAYKEFFNGNVRTDIQDDERLGFGKPGQEGSENIRWDALKTFLRGIIMFLTGNQTISGTKTFTGKVIVPIPVDDNDAVTRKFAEDLLSGSDWEVVEIDDQDFTAENFKIYIVNTTSTQRACTIPDADGSDIQIRIYKKSAITTKDVLVKTVSNQLIGGSSSQKITGQSEGIWVAGLNSSYEIIQNNRDGVQKKLSQSTGGIFGFNITTNPDNTINIGQGYISIEKIDSLESPATVPLRFDGQSNITVTNANTSGATFFYIDEFSNITQSTNTPVSDSGFRFPVRIGIAVHLAGDGTLDYAFTYFVAAQNPSARLSSLMNDIGLIKTGVKIEAVTDTSQIKNGSGVLRAPAIRTQTVPNAPDTAPIVSLNPVPTLTYFSRTAKQPSLTTIDFANYNPTGNTVEPVPGNNSACAPIYVFAAVTNEFFIQYGQNAYGSVTDALNAYVDGSESLEKHPALNLGITTLAAVIFVSKGSLNLNTAIIRQGGKIQGIAGGGGGGTAIVSRQDTYENSTPPQTTTDATRGAVITRNGGANDTVSVVTIQDTVGNSVLDVKGDHVKVDKPLGLPGFTTAQRDALTPSIGWEIYNTDTSAVETWDGTDWITTEEPASKATVSETDEVIGANVNGLQRWTFAVIKAWIQTITFLSSLVSHVRVTSAATTVYDELRRQEQVDDALAIITSDYTANKIWRVDTEAEFKAACSATGQRRVIEVSNPITVTEVVDIKPEYTIIQGADVTFADGVIITGDATYASRIIRFIDNLSVNGDNTVNYNSSVSALNISARYIRTSNFNTPRTLTFNKSGSSSFAVDYNLLRSVALAATGGADVAQADTSFPTVEYKQEWSVNSGNVSLNGDINKNGFFTISGTFIIDGSTSTPVSINPFEPFTKGIVVFDYYHGLLNEDRTININSTSIVLSDFYKKGVDATQNDFGNNEGDGERYVNNSTPSGSYFLSPDNFEDVANITLDCTDNTINTGTPNTVNIFMKGQISGFEL